MRGMVDIHCHIMFGVDDGPKAESEALKLLQREYECGVEAIILTPHYIKGVYEPSKDLVLERFTQMKYMAQEAGLDMDIYLGCEYYANSDMLEELQRNSIFRMNGSRYVLLEFSPRHSYQTIHNWIYELRNAGLCPIIAHIERYSQIVSDMEQVSALIGLGALVQINASTLIGKCGRKVKKISETLMKKGYVHFIASDTHDIKRRCPDLDLCEGYITKKWGKERAGKLLVDNPQAILNKTEDQEETDE